MRAVLSAQSLAEQTGRRFAYCWPTGTPFGARLDELWAVDERRVSLLTTRLLAARYPFRDGSETWRHDAAQDKVWQIRTGQPVTLSGAAVAWSERLRQLRPTAAVDDILRQFFDAHLRGRPYVGVMIRAHEVSHAQSREHSPIGWFVARMQQIRSVDPTMTFFLSCDVPQVQEQIANQFGNVVGQRDKGGYNSRQALRSAVVDLYLLAGSMHILGPHYSSFPELALHLSGGRIALETSTTGPDTAWENRVASMVNDPLRPT